MILLLFFCSGATALVYEVVWSKYLSLIFGSTIQAQTIVLAAFMGGLALGNRLIGAWSDRVRQPLAVYGGLEIIIGLYAYFFDGIYHQADRLFVWVGAGLFGHAAGLLLWKGALGVGLLLGPTILMGGTLPLISVWLQTRQADASRGSARFYSVNTFGAVCGAWLAAFWLIRSLGMDSTLELTALLNLLVGATAFILSRISVREARATPNVTNGTNGTNATNEPCVAHESPSGMPAQLHQALPLRHLGWLVATTGAISMGLEVLASRSLSLIFGASVQAFAIVLIAFILGIGVGSSAMASPRLKQWRSDRLLFWLLLAAAAILGTLVLGIEKWVDLYCSLRTGLARSVTGYRSYQLMAGGFSVVLLGLPAGLIGAVLPLAIRLAGEGEERLGARVGVLLTWNTLGAVAGVLLTGFLLMPLAGLRNAFNLLAAGLCMPVVLLAWRGKRLSFAAGASALVLALGLSCALGGQGWRYVLSSGMFRIRDTRADRSSLEMRKKHVKLRFYQDAADATVSVEEGEGRATGLSLRISGKVEASTSPDDMQAQLLMAHLPLLVRPEAKDVFVLGLGSGLTAAGVMAYPVEHLVIAENCAPVVAAAKWFAPWNRHVLENPATKLWVEDARTVLKLSPQKYDVIISEPSNPWFANIGSIFTEEFYRLAASRLKPGGIMVQWFHVYEMNDNIVELVLRTFGSVFPVTEVWDVNAGDLILLGSDRPWECSPASWRRSFARPQVRSDLASLGYHTPEALLARQLASQRTAFAIPGPGPLQSDVFPLLEYDAPLAFFICTNSSQISRFDERTWQAELAPTEKRAALRGLEGKLVRQAFRSLSVNAELCDALADWIIHTNAAGLPAAIPCVFVPEAPATPKPLLSLLGPETARLVASQAAPPRPGTNWLERAQNERLGLTALLTTREAPKGSLEEITRSVVASARACLAHGEYGLAKDLLEPALKLAPNEAELCYLQRILERGSQAKGLPQ